MALFLWLITHFSPAPLAVAKKFCHLLARRDALFNTALTKFSAAATILLVWEKLIDDVHDEGRTLSTKVKRRFRTMTSAAHSVLQSQGFDIAIISNAFSRQRVVECTKAESLARYAEATGEVLGHIYHHGAIIAGLHESAGVFGAIGRALGQIIYLLDSAVDYRQDIVRKVFNPLTTVCSTGHPTSSFPSQQTMDVVNAQLFKIRADIAGAIAVLPPNVRVQEALVNQLAAFTTQVCDQVIAPHPQQDTFRRCFPAWLSLPSIFGCPGSALAVGDNNTMDAFAQNAALLIIMIVVYGAICRGCRNSCACGRHRSSDDRITVDEGCGGVRTYRRDSCSGHYRNDDRGCC
jgi:hypothetical protein